MFISHKALFLSSPENSTKRKQVATEEASYANEEYEDENYNEDYDSNEDEGDNQSGGSVAQLAPNQVCVTLSYSLMNQVKHMARMEGVGQQDMILELLAEALTRRSYEDASRPAPSHLMTRSGYMGPDVNGNQMSHHQYNSNQPQNNNRRPNNNPNQRRNFNGNGNGNNYNNNGGNNKNFNNNGNRYNNNKNRFQNQGPNRNYNQGYNNPQQNQQQFNQQEGSAPAPTPGQDGSGNKE